MEGAECFLNDCLRLRKIGHRNLVKIISVCYRKGFKALVMEYMPNGSLQRLLHEKNNQNYKMESRLSLRRRLKILKEVATGLCYLHNHCKPPIIHSDVNPRNVFFDESMTAKLSDFGMSDLLWESFIAKNATINGTLGYIPPEYGLGGSLWKRGDVYSFGIMILEVLTGISPTDPMFSGDFTLTSFVGSAIAEPHEATQRLVEILRRAHEQGMVIESEEDVKVVQTLGRLGLWCTLHEPERRPTIEVVECRLETLLKKCCL